MGAAARFGFRTDRSAGKAAFAGPVLPIAIVLRSRGVVIFLAMWMIINLATGLLGFAPGIDGQIAWEAHIGGFVAGFFGLRWFDRRWRPPEWETTTAALEMQTDHGARCSLLREAGLGRGPAGRSRGGRHDG